MNKPFNRMKSTVHFRITHTIRHMTETIDHALAAENFPLAGDQAPLLLLSAQFEGRSIQDLAGIIKKDKAGILRGLRSFEKRGLIRFQDDASDRRKRLVYLTLKGLELVERMVAKTEAVEKRIIRGIAAGELDRMYATLAKISANCFKEIATDAVIRNRLGLRKPSVKKA
jgi:DNA-binding MarR family transcriptional regulator